MEHKTTKLKAIRRNFKIPNEVEQKINKKFADILLYLKYNEKRIKT